ncbi:MAG: hypothetical protein IPJ77_18405 [Planctomycetes bacterium]|nr:hypothetical protein [Planctomycetota bacterium]
MTARGACFQTTSFVACALAGVLAVLAASKVIERHARVESPSVERPQVELDLRGFGVGELRALPGVGEQRAIDVVRARWSGAISGSVESLDRVPGIGPGTVEAVRGELERRARLRGRFPVRGGAMEVVP